jgi:hypothetical protein
VQVRTRETKEGKTILSFSYPVILDGLKLREVVLKNTPGANGSFVLIKSIPGRRRNGDNDLY